MALPKLNDIPKYSLTIPSTGKEIKFRPYLVKEEKVLMLAMESQDEKQMYSSIVDTIEACVNDPIKRSLLTTFDVEYMFTQIRSKSVGETADIMLKCKQCEHSNKVQINLDNVKVENLEVNKTISITEDIILEMKWPTYLSMINSGMYKEDTQTEKTFEMIISCIDKVITDDEQISMADETKEDAMEFVESLNTGQFDKIRKFMENMPAMKSEGNFICESCGHHNKYTLQGMSDFF